MHRIPGVVEQRPAWRHVMPTARPARGSQAVIAHFDLIAPLLHQLQREPHRRPQLLRLDQAAQVALHFAVGFVVVELTAASRGRNLLMLWTVLGKDFYKPEMPGLRQTAKKLAVRLCEKTGRHFHTVNMYGVTPVTLLRMIEDGTANVVGDTVRIGESTVATISFLGKQHLLHFAP